MDEEQNVAAEPAATAEVSLAEKRQHPRIPVSWQAAVMVQQRPSMGKLGDISRGGLTFHSEVNLAIGSKQQVFIRMPRADHMGYQQLEVIAQVCSCSLAAAQGFYRVGFKILEMRGNAAEHIMHYLHLNGG